MVKTEATHFANLTYITIPTHNTVQCFTQPDPTTRVYRQFFYEVTATDVPGWEPKVQLGFEEAQIALRPAFRKPRILSMP